MVRKSLIINLSIYIFFSDILTFLSGWSQFKILLAIVVTFNFLFYAVRNIKELNLFFYLPLTLIVVYFLVWPEIGYLNLIYTMIFGWILSRDTDFSFKILKIIFFIQFILIIYESLTGQFVYEEVTNGVFISKTFDLSTQIKDLDLTGFRPKGLFVGTLVATSFIIYLAMLFRNTFKMLILIFIMSLIVNGRLALLITSITLFLHLMLNYDIRHKNKLIPFWLKILILSSLFFLFILVIIINLPPIVLENYMNIFNLETDNNFGRLLAYAQSVDLYISYSFLEKLVGKPGNIVLDQYGRESASESGFLSMMLDIGLLGLLIYLITFYSAWKIASKQDLFLKKQISFKFVIIMTFLSFLQYEHINGNLRGALFWFMIISFMDNSRNKLVSLNASV